MSYTNQATSKLNGTQPEQTWWKRLLYLFRTSSVPGELAQDPSSSSKYANELPLNIKSSTSEVTISAWKRLEGGWTHNGFNSFR